MSDIEKRIGAIITGIRLLKGLTQAQLAEKINVSVETISRMERGVAFPSLKTVEKIADALNVPVKAFFEFDEHKPKDQAFERELSKLTSFLRTRKVKEIAILHDVLKVVFKKV